MPQGRWWWWSLSQVHGAACTRGAPGLPAVLLPGNYLLFISLPDTSK